MEEEHQESKSRSESWSLAIPSLTDLKAILHGDIECGNGFGPITFQSTSSDHIRVC